ncbi:UDP-galactopyranose/dTDP-fucopyranose mutase family protein [Citreimonas salinaria]|uniref:UDP-galactopyranose mutase n=1 Tax=Citreimonas salinaria TaxID=321339 RepID=A0A1H3N4S0_9RHOB|nr:UDP-galactopyranose mutase [Citreimonas salinaria]SDY83836.1 UDP-galactopyranose mutase [Citreimonas salinaria]
MQVRIVGAGLSGAVMARELAQAGHRVTVTEARGHVAGNCHTERCAQTGVMEHRYGPHIFHTDDAGVWAYVNRFATFRPYRHQVRATHEGRVYALPVTLLTINQFFGTAMRPDEARAFVASQAETIAEPRNFEEQALSMVGSRLYAAFFEGYTRKQWGRDPRDLPAALLKRLPLRFNYDDNYFFHRFQGIPEAGYTAMVEAILDHPGIDVHLDAAFVPGDDPRADHLVWTGPLDAWFGHRLGRLGYRTLDFERFTTQGDWQGCAVMNHPDPEVPHTRITEHKHFAPWESHEGSVLYRETSREAGPDDIPYYPVRLAGEKALLAEYEALAAAETGVTFLGRLGTYRYLDMDVTIREALDAAGARLAG